MVTITGSKSPYKHPMSRRLARIRNELAKKQDRIVRKSQDMEKAFRKLMKARDDMVVFYDFKINDLRKKIEQLEDSVPSSSRRG